MLANFCNLLCGHWPAMEGFEKFNSGLDFVLHRGVRVELWCNYTFTRWRFVLLVFQDSLHAIDSVSAGQLWAFYV